MGKNEADFPKAALYGFQLRERKINAQRSLTCIIHSSPKWCMRNTCRINEEWRCPDRYYRLPRSGFSRLSRNKSDEGVVMMLMHIITSFFAPPFLRSLPRMYHLASLLSPYQRMGLFPSSAFKRPCCLPLVDHDGRRRPMAVRTVSFLRPKQRKGKVRDKKVLFSNLGIKIECL